MRLLLTIVLVAALVLSLTACDTLGEPRTLPAPSFDARGLFPNLDQRARTGRSGQDFEDQIQELMAGEDPSHEATTRAVQTVPLGAGLSSELPADGEDWRWSRQGDTTLISRESPGSPPDVMIIVKDYAMTAAMNPSREFGTFVKDIDPSLGMPFDIAALMQSAGTGQLPITQLADAQGQIEIDDFLDAIMGAATLTGGRGLGYRSAPGSFTGWRWVGQNSDDVTLRFARSRGTWGPQPELPPGMSPDAIGGILGAAAQAPPGDGPTSGLPGLPGGIDLGDLGIDLDGALQDLGGIRQTGTTDLPDGSEPPPLTVVSERPSTTRLPSRSALMYFGQVELSPARGSYVAILCAAEGDCPHAADIARFLNRIGTADAPTGRGSNFDDHAHSLGLHLH